MSQGNVEMVRVAYEVAYAERSVEGVRDGVRACPAEFEEVADGYVLVTVNQSARLRDSKRRVETTIWHLWRVEGMPQEGWVFGDRAAALEAARLAG